MLDNVSLLKNEVLSDIPSLNSSNCRSSFHSCQIACLLFFDCLWSLCVTIASIFTISFSRLHQSFQLLLFSNSISFSCYYPLLLRPTRSQHFLMLVDWSLEHSFVPTIAFLLLHHFWSLCNLELHQLWFLIRLYKDVHYLITCVYIFGNLCDESCLLLTYSSLYFVYSWRKALTWLFNLSY